MHGSFAPVIQSSCGACCFERQILDLLLLVCCAGDVVRAPCGVMHGKTSPVTHTNKGVLEGLEK